MVLLAVAATIYIDERNYMISNATIDSPIFHCDISECVWLEITFKMPKEVEYTNKHG